jgi:ABC-type lipoprotein release transport system permease subunit
MAWRNLWRNRRRTLITVSSLAFGMLLSVLFTGLGDAQWDGAIDLAARMGPGHVSVQHPDYQDLPSLQRTVTGLAALRAQVRARPGVTDAVERIAGPVMLSTAADSFGAGFVALDPAAETADTFDALGDIVEGGLFDTADGPGIVLGRRLAENLEARLGRKVVYAFTDRDGEMVSGLARVTGILETGTAGVDAGLCLLPLGTVRRALGYGPDEATQLAIFLADRREAAAVARDLDATVRPAAAALDWAHVNPDLQAFIAMKVAGTQVLEAFILLLIAAGIFNTLFVSVMERLREFGILLAIGFSPGRLFRLVLWESLWLAVVGLAAGAVVTVPAYAALHATGIDLSGQMGGERLEIAGAAMNAVLQVGIHPDHVVQIAVVIALVTLASGLYPAWRASRVQPVDAIKLV